MQFKALLLARSYKQLAADDASSSQPVGCAVIDNGGFSIYSTVIMFAAVFVLVPPEPLTVNVTV